MIKILLFFVFSTALAQAAPFIRSDATAQAVTHCGYLLDTLPKVDMPVATEAAGKYCLFDIGTLPAGAHTVRATFVNIDPIWGRSESVNSVPLGVTKPAQPVAPTGLELVK